jgi:hypothetical protein
MYRYNRLTDNDTNWGPITLGERSTTWRPLGIDLRSGNEEHPGSTLNLHFAGWWVRLAIPAVIKPWRQWVDTTRLFPDRPDSSGYWDVHGREYGFSFSDGSLFLRYGPQTHDSSTTKSKCYFLPWKQWRNVRHTMYGLEGEHFWTEATKPRRDWDDWHKAREQCPKARFLIEDFDGARIVASTYIEEREWRFGEKWCAWLSLFRRAKVKRSLSIDFAQEVGLDKGSWKGGLMGHGIDMLPGELHEAAFRRYCEQEVRSKNGRSRITFIGATP